MARINDLFSSRFHGRLGLRTALALTIVIDLHGTMLANIRLTPSYLYLGVIQLLAGSQQSLFLRIEGADISVPIPTSDVVSSQGNGDSTFEIKLHRDDAAATFARAFGPNNDVMETLLQLGPGHPAFAKVLRESKPN
jgi:hypothetical protein